MLKKVLVGGAAAAVIVTASLVAGTPAQAAQFGIYVNPGYPPDHSGCWRWSHHYHRWSWICRGYDEPYYYEPAPTFGFSFGGGGYDGHRDHHGH